MSRDGGLNEEERTKQAPEGEVALGRADYDYGARDFGEEVVDTSSAKPTAKDVDALLKE